MAPCTPDRTETLTGRNNAIAATVTSILSLGALLYHDFKFTLASSVIASIVISIAVIHRKRQETPATDDSWLDTIHKQPKHMRGEGAATMLQITPIKINLMENSNHE